MWPLLGTVSIATESKLYQCHRSYSDTDVTAGETYRYTISAYDAAGNESDQSVCKDVVAVDACILYIRADASSYGAGDGSDWNNAYSGFDEIDWENETIKPGTIIYFSGGNYTSSIIPQKSGDNSAQLSLKERFPMIMARILVGTLRWIQQHILWMEPKLVRHPENT